MNLISTYDAFLYYCCLLFISHYILDSLPHIKILLLSFFLFVPLIIFNLNGNTNLYNFTFVFFFVIQFIALKLIFRDVPFFYLAFSYIIIDSINTLLITIITTLVPFNDFLIDFIVNSITSVLFILTCLTKTRIKIRLILELSPRYVLVIVSILLIATSFLSLLIIGSSNAINQNAWNKTLNLALIILLFTISTVFPIFILNAISNNQLKSLTTNYEQQIQAQAEHYKNLAAANFETRRFKHDFKNMSIAIEKLLADGRHEQALALLQKYNNTLNSPSDFHPAFDTGNGIADALLTDKSEKASAFNAEITFNGAIPQEALSPTDLCVILGNTLDNAIEACQKLDPKMNKTIFINCNCSSGFLFLSITNPVSEKVIIHDNHVATTKENKTLHGFGLYSLHSVVKRYDGEVRLSSTDDCFTVDIDMCVTTPLKHESCLPQ